MTTEKAIAPNGDESLRQLKDIKGPDGKSFLKYENIIDYQPNKKIAWEAIKYPEYAPEIKSGFHLVAVDWCCGECCEKIGGPEDWYEITCEVTAYFDGVRHLYFCPKTGGYSNYPSTDYLVELFQLIQKLEKEYCKV